ncbi:MAG TPA: hypothetical protein VMS96_09775 [Terriglobales bacterium]|nr:hypothetical protein [Terriglobales bacterium]
MKWMKALLIAFTLIAGTAGLAAAQEGYRGWQDRDGDRDRWGYQDRDRDDRWHGDGDYDRDDGYWDNRGAQNPYYRTGIQQARENGYQWGLRDGQVDRQAGRSYRATKNETYKKATIGYVKAYGDKNHYKSVFRRAYERGYERGYGSWRYGGPYGQNRGWPWAR